METKTKASAAGAAALVTALAAGITAIHGSHSTNTAITRNDTKPLVINRPHDVNGSPLPVQVIQPTTGPPIVIVGHGAPGPAACSTRADGALPDAKCTPGATDPHVTQANIRTTICRPGGYTNQPGVRNVTTASRKKVLESYGYDAAEHFDGEIDHLISLQLGGSNDVKNLWPEEGRVPNPKDGIEGRLHADVCAGRITLRAAQRKIALDWRKG